MTAPNPGSGEGKLNYDCPSKKSYNGQHCDFWWDCEPCSWCGDNTPDPDCGCEKCLARRPLHLPVKEKEQP